MDLGKMLADAMYEAGSLKDAACDSDNPTHVWYDGPYDLTAAAEAFLAKVREAEKPTVVSEIGMSHDGESPYMRLALKFPSHSQAVAFYNQTVRRRRETSLRLHLQADPELKPDGDHTGPVPYMGEVE